MKQHQFASVAGLITLSWAIVSFASLASAQTGSGWVQLFDGKSLDGWNKVGESNWRVEDGAIVVDKMAGKDAGYLVSKDSYKDFQIKAEFWTDEEANSGIFIRCDVRDKIDSKVCYEVNIFDKRPDPSYGTGAIVYFAEVNPMQKAAGKWNTMEITADKRHLVLVFDGKKTVDVRNGLFDEGHIALQFGVGTAKFRKIEIKPL